MKLNVWLWFSCLFLFLAACKKKETPSKPVQSPQSQVQNLKTAPQINMPANMTPVSGPGALEPPKNAKGVWHFVCPNGCPEGAGSSVACPKCGSKLEHNSAYHAK